MGLSTLEYNMNATEFLLILSAIYIAPHIPTLLGIPIGLGFIALSFFFR